LRPAAHVPTILLLIIALVACAGSASVGAPSPSAGGVSKGQFAGSTDAGGKIEFTVSAIGETQVLQVEYGDITEEGFKCTAPNGEVTTVGYPAPTNFLMPATIHELRFDIEQTFEAGDYLEKLSVLGQFTSPTSAIGTAHSVVLSANPPNAQCMIDRPSMTWSAKLVAG
jgi:hypothetical protein